MNSLKRLTRAALPVLLVVWLQISAAGALAYDNQARGGEKKSPHSTINEIAVSTFVRTRISEADKPDPILKQYDIKNLTSADLHRLTGESIIGTGDFRDDLTTGDKSLTFTEWIQEGGFTADEPEIQMSLLHFYDPTIPNRDSRYLTDIPSIGDFYAKMVRRRSDPLKTLKFWNWRPWQTPRADVPTQNPQIDAVYWALEGDKEGKFFTNQYSWNKGVGYMRDAFADDTKEKDRLFAKAWRALGETMHLMGDMTLPAHVRNDAHPGNLPAGDLRPDPYEALAREDVVRAAYAAVPTDPNTRRLHLEDAVDGSLWSQLQSTDDPEMLFHYMASFTNRNFFSSDTVTGTTRGGIPITNLNGKPAYPSPVLLPTDFDENFGSYKKTVAGKDVLMVTEKTLVSKGWSIWGTKQAGSALGQQYGLDTNLDCAKSQAAVLIPNAIAGNMRLFDWYLPRVVVEIKEVDTEPLKEKLTGKITHKPYGAYPTEMTFSSGPNTVVKLYVDGKEWVSKDFKPTIKNGEIEADLSKLGIVGKVKLELSVDVGGVPVRSAPFEAELGDILKYLHKTNQIKVFYEGKGVVDIDSGSSKQRIEDRWVTVGSDIPFPASIQWNGTRFTAGAGPEAGWPTEMGGINKNRRGSLNGTVTPKGLSVADLTYTFSANDDPASHSESLTLRNLPLSIHPQTDCSDLHLATGKIFLCYIAHGAAAVESGGEAKSTYTGVDEKGRPTSIVLVRPKWENTKDLKVAFIETSK